MLHSGQIFALIERALFTKVKKNTEKKINFGFIQFLQNILEFRKELHLIQNTRGCRLI